MDLFHPTIGILKGKYRAGYGFHSINPPGSVFWHLFVYCWTWPTVPQILPVEETNTFHDLCMIGFPDTIPPRVVVYPNPSNSLIQIVGKDLVKYSILRLYDSSGRKVRELNFESESITIDIGNLSEGIYLIRLTGKDDSLIRKVMIY